MIELVDVVKNFPGEPPVNALRGVTFNIESGGAIAIVGPSGCGKSTLLHILGTLDRADGGLVRIAGFDVARLSDHQLAALRARHIGFVFQEFFLAEHATALENVGDGLLYAGTRATERRRQAEEALRRVGLGARVGFRPSRLSGGERQRVAIARAIVGNADLLLADEPTGSLDSASGAAIVDLLLQLNGAGTTLVVVTHERAVAARLHRVIDMLDGRIVSDSAARREAGA